MVVEGVTFVGVAIFEVKPTGIEVHAIVAVADGVPDKVILSMAQYRSLVATYLYLNLKFVFPIYALKLILWWTKPLEVPWLVFSL